MPVNIRPFRRSDRDQLTGLVNLHVASVLPGIALSANVVLSQLEREPEELIVDPWVEERLCLVAEVDQSIAAAVLIHRFGSHESVRDGYRAAARMRWFLFVPGQEQAAVTLLDSAIAQARRWAPSHIYFESALPAPGCVGLSDSWPHVAEVIKKAGFAGPDRRETVLACDCASLAVSGGELTGTAIKRSVGVLGTRFDLLDRDRSLGYVEVAPAGASLQRSSAPIAWADVGNLFPAQDCDLDTVMGPLLAAAARWLQLGGVERLIDYYAPDVHQPRYLEILTDLGFTELTVNHRGWEL